MLHISSIIIPEIINVTVDIRPTLEVVAGTSQASTNMLRRPMAFPYIARLFINLGS